jgi:hypothetical protein
MRILLTLGAAAGIFIAGAMVPAPASAQSLCFYLDGWNGPGFYVCGQHRIRGRGWHGNRDSRHHSDRESIRSHSYRDSSRHSRRESDRHSYRDSSRHSDRESIRGRR